jgi:hypothetical protein
VFLAIGRDAQRDNETAIAEMHAVDQHCHQVERVKWRALPGRELRRRPGDEAPADCALAGAAALDLGTDWLQAPRVLPRRDAHEHLLDDAPLEGIGGPPSPRS